MSTGWNGLNDPDAWAQIINLLGNEYWLERALYLREILLYYKPTGK